MKHGEWDDEISREMGILGPWPSLIRRFTWKLPAPAPSSDLMLRGGKCCIPRLAGRSPGSWSGRTPLHPPRVSPGFGQVVHPWRGPAPRACRLHPPSWAPFHLPSPRSRWGLVREGATPAAFPCSVASFTADEPNVSHAPAVHLGEGWRGQATRSLVVSIGNPPTLLGSSGSRVAHFSCLAIYLWLCLWYFQLWLVVVLLPLPGSMMSIKLNY